MGITTHSIFFLNRMKNEGDITTYKTDEALNNREFLGSRPDRS